MLILAQIPNSETLLSTAIQGGAITVAIFLALGLLIFLGLLWRFAPKIFDWFSKIVNKGTDLITALSTALEKLQKLSELSDNRLAENTQFTKQSIAISERIETAVNTTNNTATQTAADITAIKKTLDTLGENVQKLAIDSGANTGALSEVRVKLSELADAVTVAVAKLQTPPQQTTTVNVATVPTDSNASKDQMDKE